MSSFIQCFTKLIDLNKIKRSDATNIKYVCSEGCSSLSGVQDCLEHRVECVSSSVFVTHNQYSWMWGSAADTQQGPLIVSRTNVISPSESSVDVIYTVYIYTRMKPPFPLCPWTHRPVFRIPSSSKASVVPIIIKLSGRMQLNPGCSVVEFKVCLGVETEERSQMLAYLCL